MLQRIHVRYVAQADHSSMQGLSPHCGKVTVCGICCSAEALIALRCRGVDSHHCMQQPTEDENAIYEDENGNQEVPPDVGVVFNVSVTKGDECLV